MLRIFVYSPYCLEGEFCELRLYGVLRSWVLPDPGTAGVDARASKEPVEVAIGGQGPRRATQVAEDYVEDRVGQDMAYGEAHHVQHDL